MPATGKNRPALSELDVATRLTVLTADSMTDPSINILGAVGAVRAEPVEIGWIGKVVRQTYQITLIS